MKNKLKSDERQSVNNDQKVPVNNTSPSVFYKLIDHPLKIFIIFVILGCSIYSNTLHAPFEFDDLTNIRDNPNVHLQDFSYQSIFKVLKSNRPVAMLSFAITDFFGRNNVLLFHVVNIGIHIVTAFVLYLLLMEIWLLIRQEDEYAAFIDYRQAKFIAFMTSLIWLVHPINIQAVTYIVQRMTSMATLFYLLCFLLYLKAKKADSKNKMYLSIGCLLSGLLALGSKENAATLPIFLILFEWFFYRKMSRDWMKKSLLLGGAFFIFLGLLSLLYMGFNPFNAILSEYSTWNFNLTQRLLTEFRVIIYYITLLVLPLPSRLNVDYDYPISHSIVQPITTLLCICAIACLLSFAIARSRKNRILAFCIFWYLGNLAIESSFIALDLVFEHRLYLPSIAFILLFCLACYRYIKNRQVQVVLLVGLACVFSVWTYQRNHVWTQSALLWADCVKKSPNLARPHNNLGFALNAKGDYQDAILHYKKAIELKPNYPDALTNLGAALANHGDFSEAEQYLKKAIVLEPKHAIAYNNMGLVSAKQGKAQEAIDYFEKAIDANPNYANAYCNLGMALASFGKFDQAAMDFQKAISLNPEYVDAHKWLGHTYIRMGKPKEALEQYKQALYLYPNAEAFYNIGLTLYGLGDVEQSMANMQQAIALNPNYAEAHYNLANMLVRQGKPDLAIKQYQAAITIVPKYAKAHYNLAMLYLKLGIIDGAKFHFKKILEIQPDNKEIKAQLDRLENYGKPGMQP